MISLDFKAAKAGFFDRKTVLDAVDRATVKVFKTYGRLVRKRAQASLKYGDKTSAPGSPPTARKTRKITRRSKSTGKVRVRTVSFLREFLFFSYDAASKSVVIGPARLDKTTFPEALPALEFGGTSRVTDHGKTRPVSVKARPFMRPAAAAEQAGLPALWKDSVR